MKSLTRALLLAGVLSGLAAPSLASTVNVNLGMTPVEVGTTNLVPGFNPNYYELNVGASGSGWVGTLISLVDSAPEVQSVTYTIYNDDNGAVGSWSQGSEVATWTFVDILGSATSTHFLNLAANTQYVLKMVASGTGPANGSTSSISAVPLPAAAWLFGSALLGFGALRRKQKSDVAAV